MLYLTQPIPDPTEGAALIDRTDLDECTCMRPEPRLPFPLPVPERVPVSAEMARDLRVMRTRLGLTLKELGAMVGMSESGICLLLNRRRKSTNEHTYEKLAALLGRERMAA